MLKLICMYILSFCGGYGSGAIFKEGIENKKPVVTVLGVIGMAGSLYGAVTAGEAVWDKFTEEREDKIK